MTEVLLYDCDGVLGDTEQFGHLPAFNQMWSELCVRWSWSVEEYGRKLAIGGVLIFRVGLARDVGVLFDEGGIAGVEVAEPEFDRDLEIDAMHQAGVGGEKTRAFKLRAQAF